MKVYSKRAVTNVCTLVMCSPMENGLPGCDGRDGREGPQGENGDPGRVGIMVLSSWEGISIGIINNPATLGILL
uniref:Surfactant protein D n=1 Tax=Rousettus aegyptiacus TaxID=9407 RepID=A0A7J8GGN3_ROUAE|nr:surfactant protein D [Rousettus aegyptiacus]